MYTTNKDAQISHRSIRPVFTLQQRTLAASRTEPASGKRQKVLNHPTAPQELDCVPSILTLLSVSIRWCRRC
jgi:hypothetical protein